MKKNLFLLSILIVCGIIKPVYGYSFSSNVNGKTLYFSFSGGSVVVTHPGNNWNGYTKPTGAVNIPNTVTYNGATWNVVGIDSYAFEDCSEITSVTIGGNVSSIGEYAFYGCSRLTSITCNAFNPPTVGSNAFTRVSSNTPVTVPCGREENYRQASRWSQFLNYYEDGALSGVTAVSSDTSMGTVSLNGCKDQATATAKYGYQFTQWNDGNTTNPRAPLSNNTSYIASFSPILYTVTSTVNYSTRGGIQRSGTTYYKDTVVLTAVPTQGYEFSYWDAAGTPYHNSTENPLRVVVNGNMTIKAVFGTAHHIVTVLSSNDTLGYVTGGGSYTYLSYANIEAHPFTGARFVRWNDGYTLSSRQVYVSKDTTMTAIFETIPQYTITAEPNDSVMGYVSGIGTFYQGNSTTIRANANPGYRFVGWSDGNTSISRQIFVMGDIFLTAIFEAIPVYMVSVESNDSTMGMVVGGGSYYENNQVSLTASANAGCYFVRWNDGNTNNPRQFYITQDTAISAVFAKYNYIIKALVGNAAQGTVDGTDTVHYGDTVVLEATPNEHYSFMYWKDNYGVEYGANPLVVQASSSRTYTAYFSVEQFFVTMLTDGGGTSQINGVGVSGNADYLSQITIFATPNNGANFSRWQDGSYYNPRTVTITKDTVFTALFTMSTPYDTIVIHDTSYVDVYMYDTTVVTDTLMIVHTDTLTVVQIDTLMQTDTLWLVDTLWLTDTLWLHDTVTVHDTIYVQQDGIGDVEVVSAKIYASDGGVVVEGDGVLPEVRVYDAVGRLVGRVAPGTDVRHRFDVPSTGVYMVRIGTLPPRRVVVLR